MLYTRKGDNGTTKTFDAAPGVRISKASCRIESLGTMDEMNSFLGLAKVKAEQIGFNLESKHHSFACIVHQVQQNLFIIQAELAGAPKSIDESKVKWLEELTDAMEREMPPITTFFISGGTEIAALFDVCRTLARKAERRVVKGVEIGEVKVGEHTLAFLNRLSSLLYAMARLSNHKSGINEESPNYQ